MLKRIGLITGVLVLVGVMLLAPLAASARVMGGEEDTVFIGAGETIDDDLYVAGNSIVIEGTVNGDVYAAASTITVRGTVNGDVFAIGQDVLVGGKVTGSVRVAGQTIRLDNTQVGNSVSAAGQAVTIESNTVIGGGLTTAGSTVMIRGKVARSLMAAGADVTLAGETGREAQLAGDKLTLANTAAVAGNLTYYGENELRRDQGARVDGEVKRVAPESRQDPSPGPSVWGIVWGLLALYVAGALLLWLAPTTLRSGAQVVTGKPWLGLAIGALVMLLALPALIILMITLIGIPVALILAVLYLIALYLAKFVVALGVGGLIARRTDWAPNAYADAGIGLILLTILELIPVIGGLVTFVVIVLGSGALMVGRYRLMRPVATK